MGFEHVLSHPDMILQATLESLWMIGGSLVLSVLLGFPLGVVLTITGPGHLHPQPAIHQVLGSLINLFRSVPYIVLILWMIPISRFLFGTSFGTQAAMVSLVAGAAPFFARLVEGSLREVDRGVLEAARAMGAHTGHMIFKVLLPESLPSLVGNITVTAVALVSYSAMAGLVAGGGLGALAWNEGYNSFKDDVLFVATALLVLMVQGLQWAGDWWVRRVDHR